MADEKNHISGIFNYCDAWCERCPFTSRCGNFAMGEEMRHMEASGADENARFWRELEEAVENASEEADDTDIFDGNPAPTGFGDEFEEEMRYVTAKEHPCAASAYSYIDMINEWFKAANFTFDESSGRELPVRGVAAGTIHYQDAVEVVRWFQRLMYVKILRAVRGALDDRAIELDPQGDENGSAKVALLGMDHSLAAWGILLKAFPEYKDRTVPIMAKLAGLRRMTEEEFPGARGFIRPGFDEG